MTSWRTASVTLLSFSSGLPLGLVWIAIPDWMRSAGADIKVIGLVTLAHAPWSFKLLWSPLMDRYQIPWLGRRRGWIAISQIALMGLGLALAGLGSNPDAFWVLLALALAIAFAAATQDIAYDAWTVDVLKPEEQGVAAGARTAMYRTAMFLAGAMAITSAAWLSWPMVNVILALLYLPMLLITIKAPEPEEVTQAPRTVREAVWLPFLGFLGRHRAVEILAFVFFYKFADNVAEALLRPFLVDMGYTEVQRGVALGTVGFFTIAVGALIGGAITTTIGLGHALWVFGLLQITSNVGYIAVARSEPGYTLLLLAMGFENLAKGLGTGAFTALLLRMTQKRFSATQYALFTSLFALPRIVSGPVSGFIVDAVGWEWFFWSTMAMGVPGLLLLQRFSPLGVRDPIITVEEAAAGPPLSRAGLWARGIVGGAIGLVAGVLCVALMAALKAARGEGAPPFDFTASLLTLLRPVAFGDWLELLGLVLFGAIIGLATAAIFAARRGGGARAAAASA
jgi:PAT family beta-lactamase induction signal transducer AmpG